jgi:hypothetical protein
MESVFRVSQEVSRPSTTLPFARLVRQADIQQDRELRCARRDVGRASTPRPLENQPSSLKLARLGQCVHYLREPERDRQSKGDKERKRVCIYQWQRVAEICNKKPIWPNWLGMSNLTYTRTQPTRL